MLHRTRTEGFGSVCLVTLGAAEDLAHSVIPQLFAELARINDKYSAHSPDSLITAINARAGADDVTALDAESRRLFELVLALRAATNNVYDPTSSVLKSLYQNGTLVATPSQTAELLNRVGWSHVVLDQRGVAISRAGVSINIDACARAYALDCMRSILVRHGVRHACIELARDAVTIGKQPDGANWLIGVRSPLGAKSTIRRIKVNDRGFSQRGVFDHLYTFNGESYGNALSPVDGYPLPGLVSVGVIADSCLDAYCAATVARMKTEQAGIAFLNKTALPWLAINRELASAGPLAR